MSLQQMLENWHGRQMGINERSEKDSISEFFTEKRNLDRFS